MPERPRSATPVPGDQLTVDRLAFLSGTTTRNVRAFQTLGLLPRPALHGRTGLYGPEHLDRLRAILRLQRSGFSLGAIGTLFDAWERGLTLEQVLGLPGSTVPGLRSDPDDGDDDLDVFDEWPAPRIARSLVVVPTTVVDQMAS